MCTEKDENRLSRALPTRFTVCPGSGGQRGAVLLCLALLCFPACAARKDFRSAGEQDTPQAWQAFLDRHGDKKKYADRAADRLEELTFEQAGREDTFAAYSAFLQAYPTGRFSREAETRGEDRRAEELGIRLYRTLPKDYYEKVNTRALPYRILVRASAGHGEPASELDVKWYSDLDRRDLFVPMNPRKAYPVTPDITLSLQQAVVYLCGRPRAYVEAETWVRGTRVKTYRVAAWSRVENALLYEVFCDRSLYDAVLAIPEQEKQDVRDRFEDLKRRMPKRGSVALEVDVRQDASRWDREMALEFSAFLNALGPYEEFATYLRGQPPARTFGQRLYFRVDPEIHAPYVRTTWSSVGEALSWSPWNSKWIDTEKEHFFRKMTLDLAAFLAENPSESSQGGKGLGRPIYLR